MPSTTTGYLLNMIFNNINNNNKSKNKLKSFILSTWGCSLGHELEHVPHAYLGYVYDISLNLGWMFSVVGKILRIHPQLAGPNAPHMLSLQNFLGIRLPEFWPCHLMA